MKVGVILHWTFQTLYRILCIQINNIKINKNLHPNFKKLKSIGENDLMCAKERSFIHEFQKFF